MTPKLRPQVDASIIGELIIGEIPIWHVGVCSLTYDNETEKLKVRGDNDHLIYTQSYDELPRREPNDYEVEIFGDHEPMDLEAIAEDVNEAIQEEHDSL